MAEQLKFSNPMMAKEDDDEEAEAIKIDNPLAAPLNASAKSEHQKQMEQYFEEEDESEEIDGVVPALILYYLFEDATCELPQLLASEWSCLSSTLRRCCRV